MNSKVTFVYTRPSQSVEWYKFSKSEADYIKQNYPDLETRSKLSVNLLTRTVVRYGEESRLNSYVNELFTTNSILNDRIKYCDANGITYTYSFSETRQRPDIPTAPVDPPIEIDTLE